ncbi:MAG: dienelactone hydrolase family protein [Burkholderiales bacterium]|nr:dienelactone hydrolase family protein [Burkholderiales bacterium]
MIEHHLEIATPDGSMNTFYVHPEEGGPHPAVLFYMDAPGKREELHDMARRIAAVGYCVVLPNLYYRRTPEFLMERTEEGMKRMFEMMDHLSNALIARDTGALLAFVDSRPEIDHSRVGAVGYCMSGPFVVTAAAHYPQRLSCIASIYGARMVTDQPDSPHRVLDKVKCESYFACAEIDHYAPREMIDTLEASLRQAGTKYRLDWYPGAQHGFAFPQRKGIYDQPSAERHWERLFDLFDRTLRR